MIPPGDRGHNSTGKRRRRLGRNRTTSATILHGKSKHSILVQVIVVGMETGSPRANYIILQLAGRRPSVVLQFSVSDRSNIYDLVFEIHVCPMNVERHVSGTLFTPSKGKVGRSLLGTAHRAPIPHQ